MHSTQSQLFADHHNFLRLLKVFEAELNWYEQGQPGRVNLATILDIFDYLQFYAETYHHPAEEAIYTLLLQRTLAEAELVAQLKAEHKQLDDITRRARRLFNAVASDSVVPVDQLVKAGREFVERHREHIEKENEHVYPLLSAHVSEDEWERVTKELDKQREPFFSHAIEEEYHNLYETILEAEHDFFNSAMGATDAPPTNELPV